MLNLMEKRVRVTSSNSEAKCDQLGDYMEDQISTLPDEILVNILSLLRMKEAIRTRVLSRRWENLWKFITGSLDFDASKNLLMMRPYDPPVVIPVRPKYISWVNQILNLHQGPTIKEFRVIFDLDESCGHAIDRWINFAIEKRVQRLKLDLLTYMGCRQLYTYVFPFWMLDLPLPGFSSFDTLTSLCLKSVSITDEVLAYFLSNCPSLEKLTVNNSKSLVSVRVVGPSLKLRYLKIIKCFDIKNVEILDTKLVRFKYFGPNINIATKNVALLVDASVCDAFSFAQFYQNSGCLSQYETLVFDLDYTVAQLKVYCVENYRVFSMLKRLELKLEAHGDQSILLLTTLLNESPCLHIFVIKLVCDGHPKRKMYLASSKERTELVLKSPHQCLKVVELVGWGGHACDFELAMWLLKNTVSLEKIILDPTGRPRRFVFLQSEENGKIAVEAARKRAKDLKPKIPFGAKLIIL